MGPVTLKGKWKEGESQGAGQVPGLRGLRESVQAQLGDTTKHCEIQSLHRDSGNSAHTQGAHAHNLHSDTYKHKHAHTIHTQKRMPACITHTSIHR